MQGPATLFGRAEEQDALERILVDARLGSSRVLVVSGEPGIGKTVMLGWVAERARSVGMEVLSARGIQSEAEVPFGGLLELLRPALGEVDRLPEGQAEALSSGLGLGPTLERDRFLVGAAVLNLLSVRSERAPVVVLVDDAHWLDDSSLAAVLFAARRLVVDHVAVVLATRPGESPALAAARLPGLSLTGVDAQAASEIVALHATQPLPVDVVRSLERAAAGNPLALAELAATAGDLDLGGADASLEVETSVGAAYERRMVGLAPSARRVLALAAAEDAGRLAWIESAARELGLDLADLEPAERAGLVTIAFGDLAWRHPLARSAAYRGVPAADRRAMHAALARSLPDGEADRRTWHRAAAALGPDEDVAAALEETGRRARSRSGYGAAATAAERAARLTPDDGPRARRLFAAAEAAWLGGQAARALALLDDALALGPDPALRAQIQHLRGQAIIRAGDVMAGHDVLVDGAAAVERSDPVTAVLMLAEAADACVYAGRPGAMLGPARRAFELLGSERGEPARFFANLALGTALIYGGESDEGAERLREAGAVLEASDALSSDPRSLSLAALAPLWLREAGAGGSLVDRAVEAARSSGALGALPFALLLAGRDAATTDRWALGRAFYDEAIGLARESGQQMPLCGALAGLAWLEARLGEDEACGAHAEEALALSERHGLGLFRVWALDALAERDIARGRIDDAASRLEEKRRTLDELGVTDPDLSPVPEQIEMAVRAGAAGGLVEPLDAFARAARSKGQPWALARLARAEGLLAEPDAFTGRFSEALAFHDATPDRFEAARTRLCFGERLRRAGQRVQAREQLRAAAATFEALGAAPWSERAHGELVATGERARRRDPSTLDDLTPQELQIALVLTSGHTTREAAAKLFLSPKTVEYHLRNAYRKLGIHSREELARELARMQNQGGP